MRQYRIVSADFVTPGDSGDQDAYMSPAQLAELKKLAGIDTLGLLEDYTAGGHENSPPGQDAQATDQEMSSPLGGKDSMPDSEKYQIQKQNHIKPGSPEWFRLWFSKEWLTGEKPIGDAPASKTPIKKDGDQPRA
jgi:hypothetical protein